ncbi:hypothetical protein [Haloplanus halobius]|uniref:hypothetical protein n=1 Tax=Haloplanus halobius TaxID=2934938 RepID=UPI00200FC735|nr:hypothetical protein [Haloplanus sp. XH21]
MAEELDISPLDAITTSVAKRRRFVGIAATGGGEIVTSTETDGPDLVGRATPTDNYLNSDSILIHSSLSLPTGNRNCRIPVF